MFYRAGCQWVELDPTQVREGRLPANLPEIAIHGGGGGFVEPYTDVLRALEQLTPRFRQVFLLPHSIGGDKAAAYLQTAPASLTLYAREPRSLAFARQHAVLANVLYADDLSFSFDYSPYHTTGVGQLNCFRTDMERHPQQQAPSDNVDLSTITGPADDPHPWLDAVSKFRHVRTDRLHVAIVAAFMGKTVELYPGGYWKNRVMYDHAIKPRFPLTVTWREWSP